MKHSVSEKQPSFDECMRELEKLDSRFADTELGSFPELKEHISRDHEFRAAPTRLMGLIKQLDTLLDIDGFDLQCFLAEWSALILRLERKSKISQVREERALKAEREQDIKRKDKNLKGYSAVRFYYYCKWYRAELEGNANGRDFFSEYDDDQKVVDKIRDYDTPDPRLLNPKYQKKSEESERNAWNGFYDGFQRFRLVLEEQYDLKEVLEKLLSFEDERCVELLCWAAVFPDEFRSGKIPNKIDFKGTRDQLVSNGNGAPLLFFELLDELKEHIAEGSLRGYSDRMAESCLSWIEERYTDNLVFSKNGTKYLDLSKILGSGRWVEDD